MSNRHRYRPGGGRSTRSGESPPESDAATSAMLPFQSTFRLCRPAAKSCRSAGMLIDLGAPSQEQTYRPASRPPARTAAPGVWSPAGAAAAVPVTRGRSSVHCQTGVSVSALIPSAVPFIIDCFCRSITCDPFQAPFGLPVRGYRGGSLRTIHQRVELHQRRGGVAREPHAAEIRERRSATRRRRETTVNACSIRRFAGVDDPIPEE
jgi:hypothetical protein